MRVAVVDTTTTDADGLHSVVNIIMADPSDPAPDGFLFVADDVGVDVSWRWGATQGFVAPLRADAVDEATAQAELSGAPLP